MSNLLETMKTRRSIRKFKGEPIPKDILDQIIEAGMYAALVFWAMCTPLLSSTQSNIYQTEYSSQGSIPISQLINL